MLRGANALSLDSKGRLSMPARYRDWLMDTCEAQLVCTIDIKHPCLLLYPINEWERIEKKLLSLSTMVAAERRLQRVLLGHAVECVMDKNGRLLIPPLLRQHAQLNKKIMLVGQLNKFELWSEQQWLQQISDDLVDIEMDDELSNNLKDFSL